MALEESSLLPGLKDEVLLGGLKQMQILQTKTTWIIVHGSGMEFPLGPNLQKHQFTSYDAEKRARTDFLSMYDYMARVYAPRPSDVHPKPHARVGASQYRSMFEYMITKHSAQVKRRSRRVYEKPSVIYKRALPEKDEVVEKRKEVESHGQELEVQNVEDELGKVSLRKSQVLPRESHEVENAIQDSSVHIVQEGIGEVTLRKSQVLLRDSKELENSNEDSRVPITEEGIGEVSLRKSQVLPTKSEGGENSMTNSNGIIVKGEIGEAALRKSEVLPNNESGGGESSLKDSKVSVFDDGTQTLAS